MPQPLSSKISKDPNAFAIAGSGGEDEIEKNPELAILAMRSIASWSSVEHCLLNAHVTLLGGPLFYEFSLEAHVPSDQRRQSLVEILAG